MTLKSFAELTKQVHQLNDLILTDMICGNVDYSEEFLTFSRHLFATKYWFVRISWANKRRYILALLEDVQSAWTLSLLLKSLWNCRPKDAVLSANQIQPWSIYDQIPLDHNRTALPISTLGQVMTNDRKWFHLIDPESQAIVLAELLTIAGGPVMWEVLRRAQMIYERHRDQALTNLLGCIVVDQSVVLASQPANTSQAPVESKKLSGKMKKESVTSRLVEENESDYEIVTTEPSLPPLPPKITPAEAQKKLEASLDAWNNIIKGIRDTQKLEELEMTFTNGTKQKIWKVNRIVPEATETVDFIQLLPSAVAKRIFALLPKPFLLECAKVNKYWSYLVEELKLEQAARVKLDSDLLKLQDVMVKHDISLEALVSSGMVQLAVSTATSVDPYSRRVPPSYRPSEKSAGGVSFRHMVVEKLKPKEKIKPKPIRRLADLKDRLEQRGAADENLWQWCENSLKYWEGRNPKTKAEEGVLICTDKYFPCPLMKHSLELPMLKPLTRDPASSTAGLPKARRNFSYGSGMNISKEPDNKRFSLWSRDFSSLYKVFKVASYQSPV